VALSQDLVRDFPEVADYKSDLAKDLALDGQMLYAMDRRRQGEQQFRRALAYLEQLVDENPHSLDHRDLYEGVLIEHMGPYLAWTHSDLRAALQLLDEARARIDSSLLLHSNDRNREFYSAKFHVLRAMLLCELGRYVEAVLAIEEIPANFSHYTAPPIDEDVFDSSPRALGADRHQFLAFTHQSNDKMRSAHIAWDASQILRECSILAQQDDQTPPEERSIKAQDYAERAQNFDREFQRGVEDWVEHQTRHRAYDGGSLMQLIELEISASELPRGSLESGWTLPGWSLHFGLKLIDQAVNDLHDQELAFVAACITSWPGDDFRRDPDLALRLAQRSVNAKSTVQRAKTPRETTLCVPSHITSWGTRKTP
jgi:tetratricopeptide (TPR) repeat protein